MKSPVYGVGRNRKRNKGSFHPSAANVNLRGAKTQRQICRCCVCINEKDKALKKEHMKEIGRRKDD